MNTAYELLTKTERLVVKELCKCGSDKVIAKALDISPITVKTHMRHIRLKTKLPNRTMVALWAMEHGYNV